jgi:hypothetical protein
MHQADFVGVGIPPVQRHSVAGMWKQMVELPYIIDLATLQILYS